MIQNLELDTLSGPAASPKPARHLSRFPAQRASRRAATAVHVPETLTVFAEPAFSSLWDLNLLDRLSEPLSRYHE